MDKRLKEFEIKEIEFGHQFLTVYGAPHSALLYIGTLLQARMKSPLRELNRKALRHIAGDPMIFHPYGDPDELGREHGKHFHVIYPYKPQVRDALHLIEDIRSLGCEVPNIVKFSKLEDRVLPHIDIEAAAQRSGDLLRWWLELRTETIHELVEMMEN
jgi:hypothetical protein